MKNAKKKLQALLISPHAPADDYTVAMAKAIPLGPIRIATSLNQNNINAAVLNLTPFQRPGEIQSRLADALGSVAKNGTIGISLNVSVLRAGAYELIKTIRRLRPDIALGLGGNHATHLYRSLIEHLDIDFAAVGEAEQTFTTYLATRGGQEPPAGIVTPENINSPLSAQTSYVEDLDALPIPDYNLTNLAIQKELYALPIHAYRPAALTLEDGLMIETSRGCPRNCAFCAVANRPFRRHSPQYMENYIRQLNEQHKFNSFSLIDDFFTHSRLHADEFCQRVRQLPFPITWAVQTRADLLDKELLLSMKAAGCRLIAFGVETGSPGVQDKINKKLHLNKAVETLRLTRETGIKIQTFFLVGHPGETEQDIQKSAEFIQQTAPDQFCIDTLKVFPGTELYKQMKQAGAIDDNYWLNSENPIPVQASRLDAETLNSFKAKLEYAYHKTKNARPRAKLRALLGPNFTPGGRLANDMQIHEIFTGRPGNIHLTLKDSENRYHVLLEHYSSETGAIIIKAVPDPFAAAPPARSLNQIISRLNEQLRACSNGKNA